jgi:hypothetical protein
VHASAIVSHAHIGIYAAVYIIVKALYAFSFALCSVFCHR